MDNNRTNELTPIRTHSNRNHRSTEHYRKWRILQEATKINLDIGCNKLKMELRATSPDGKIFALFTCC